MGDRYFLNPKCPHCGHIEDDFYYYAPTSGFMTHKCESCDKVIDLEELSGINAESTASTEYGIKAIKKQKRRMKGIRERK
jgi:ribosomal protein S27E